MSEDLNIKIKIDADTGNASVSISEIQRKLNELQKQSDQTKPQKNFDLFKDSLNEISPALGSIASKLGSIAGPVAAVAGVAYGLKRAFDFTIEGEKLQTIAKNFDFLAINAGVAGSKLREAFDRAADGMIDTDELLASTAKKLGDLGTNAEKLPELLSLSLKSAKASGQDAGDLFDKITQSLISLNTKGLNQIGIKIDADQVFKAAGAITELEKRTALTTAVLAELGGTFGGINAKTNDVTGSWQRFKVIADDFFDMFKVGIAQAFGPMFKATLDVATASVEILGKQFKNFLQLIGFETASSKIGTLKDSLASLQEEIKGYQRLSDVGFITQDQQKRFDMLKNSIVAVEAEINGLEQTESKAAATKRKANEETEKQLKISLALAKQLEEEKKLREKALTDLTQIEKENFDKSFANKVAYSLSIEQQEGAELEKLSQSNIKKMAEFQKLYDDGIIALDVYNRAKTDMSLQYELGVDELRAKYAEKEKAENEKKNKVSLEIANMFQQGMLRIVSTSLETIGASLVKGGDAWANFGNTVKGIIGDMMVNVGNALIAQGLGIEALKTAFASLSGGMAIAAGAALVILGGALKAGAGGALTSAATSGPSGSSIDNSTTLPTVATGDDVNKLKERETKQQVVVNIDNFMGDESAGAKIVDFINSAIDGKGVQIRSGAFA